MKPGFKAIALAATLTLSLTMCAAVQAQQQQPSVPDAPKPQSTPPLVGADGTSITPGMGAGNEPTGPSSSSVAQPQEQAPPSSLPPSTSGKDTFQTTPPEGIDALPRFVVNTNFVELPVTVKDAKGKMVAGLTWRDFKV